MIKPEFAIVSRKKKIYSSGTQRQHIDDWRQSGLNINGTTLRNSASVTI